MKRSALFFSLLLAATPVLAGAKNPGTITTLAGKSFHECKIVRIYPDGVSFTHRDGAAKIVFKDLPAKLREQFSYDPQKEAEYQREQEARRKEEQERARKYEIAMQEKLMEAQMAEASYLAAAAKSASQAPVSSGFQTASWVGTPITGPAVGGSNYRSSSFAGYPFSGGYGYPAYGHCHTPYGAYGHGYPCGGFGYGYAPTGVYVNPTIYRSWNVGSGFRVGVGISPFGSGIRLFP